MIGPLVDLRLVPIARARMFARVVLPRPGGPLSRMWSSASPRCLAAATAISSRSLTFAWPVKSEKRDGRNVSSNTTSGLFNVEIGRSAIARQDAKRAMKRQGERGIGLDI